jgi:hypothetical protein
MGAEQEEALRDTVSFAGTWAHEKGPKLSEKAFPELGESSEVGDGLQGKACRRWRWSVAFRAVEELRKVH